MSPLPTWKRLSTIVASAGLLIGVACTGAAASPSHGHGAAAWLADQANEDGGFGDPGLTADAIFAFVSADVGAEYTAAAAEFLADRSVLDGYIGTPDTGYRAPQTAKILLAAQASGSDVTDFGGVDLEMTLRGLEDEDGAFDGVLAQQLAVLALARSQQGVSAEAVEALVSMQCDDGGYGYSTSGGDCAGDVDFTAYTLAALLAANETVASTRALDWLESVQGESGGFRAGFPGAPENTNSTGLAAGALAGGGRDIAADKAVNFVIGLQQGCDAPVAERGAIAYDESGFNPGTAIMATAQAITGITGEFLDALDPSDDVADLPGLGCDGEDHASPPADLDTDEGATPKLPATGASLTIPVLIGVVSVIAGAVMLIAARSRTEQTAQG